VLWGAHGRVRVGLNAEKAGEVGRVMIVAITDGRASVSLKRSLGEEETEDGQPHKPSQQELKVGFFFFFFFAPFMFCGGGCLYSPSLGSGNSSDEPYAVGAMRV